ncbi:N-acetylglucosamine-6-phosphate deacetylase [Thermoanaerobacterium thermosaccharolyticum]|uniref:N-acetylglucosamine-6-phosphate deacetylase n=1 Tax=Thermoanaerobacterium thermosaccharolyticum TaxID=1517 RepID=UPI003D2AF7DF
MENILIKNGEIYTKDKILYDCDLLITNSIISEVGKNININNKSNIQIINAHGKKVLPGFIDIHTHGAIGYDTMDANYESLNNISMYLASHGITSFCATTMTEDIQHIIDALTNINYTITKGTDGATILGAYLEGPFISEKQKGAQNVNYIIKPDVKLLEKFTNLSNNCLKVIAIAPEKDPNGYFINYCNKKNIKVSLGHTNASYEEMKNAVDYGASIAVHVYNAMKGFHHREPGALGEALLDNRLYCELICDFIHSHPAAVKMLIKMKGTEKIILISDAMLACGLSDGEYEFGGQKVIVDQSIARIQNGSLAGSTLSLDKAVANITTLGIPLSDAAKMASFNPAKAINIDDKKGSIDIGKDADIVILDNDLSVNMTIVNGNIVYRK